MGIIFLCALVLLFESKYRESVFILSAILIASQFVLNFWDIKNIIDFLFGPFVLIILFDLLINKKVPELMLLKYQKRFYYLLWLPIGIGVLQYFDLLPITFWNASYVNYSYSGEVPIPRPNGFLYHGSELSIIICFVALFQFFNKNKVGFLLFIAIILIAYTTYFKAILGCVLALFFVYLLFKSKKIRQMLSGISDKIIIVSSLFFGLMVVIATAYYLNLSYKNTGYFFDPQLMTGRGAIWNIYTDAISDYSILNYMFGSGIGSGPELFTTYASAKNYYILSIGLPLEVAYDAHNAILSLFVNSGFFGLVSFIFLGIFIFKNVIKWQNDARRNKYLFFVFMLIPIFTIGITIPLFDMAIIWPCLGFLLIKWKCYSYE